MHGPITADALIPAAVKGKWNMVIACYQDQGHTLLKAVYSHDGMNIAGQGIAREASLVLSMRRAAQLAPGWDHVWQIAQKR